MDLEARFHKVEGSLADADVRFDSAKEYLALAGRLHAVQELRAAGAAEAHFVQRFAFRQTSGDCRDYSAHPLRILDGGDDRRFHDARGSDKEVDVADDA